jgi:threonine/homoserine/homoserine lactone efflux protein
VRREVGEGAAAHIVLVAELAHVLQVEQVAVVLVLVPGPDFAVVTKNTLAGGRPRGWSSAAGVTCSNAVQGVTAAAGLGAVIVGVQPLFEAIKWAGIAYLAFLAIQSLRSAAAGRYLPFDEERTPSTSSAEGRRQGFISNITNPKVLVFYLAVLPQFLGPHPSLLALVALALSHAALSLLYLLLLVTGLVRVRRVLTRRPVRRALHAVTGVALLGFGAKLAVDSR